MQNPWQESIWCFPLLDVLAMTVPKLMLGLFRWTPSSFLPDILPTPKWVVGHDTSTFSLQICWGISEFFRRSSIQSSFGILSKSRRRRNDKLRYVWHGCHMVNVNLELLIDLLCRYFHFGNSFGLGFCNGTGSTNPRQNCLNAVQSDITDMLTIAHNHSSSLKINGKPALVIYNDAALMSSSDWVVMCHSCTNNWCQDYPHER